MTTSGPHKSLLELSREEPGLYRPKLLEAQGLTSGAVPGRLGDLQRSHEPLREQLAALQLRNQELEAYAHTVAHELKNPLAAIILTSSAISDIADLTPAELRGFLEQIKASAYEMNGIIRDLLLLAEVRKADVPAGPVDMGRVVAKTCRRLRLMIEEYEGRISCPQGWPAAIGYAPWIEEVWANLISNALKYGGQPPRVELGAEAQLDGTVRFWARDNGPGLSREDRAHLFAPFARAGRPRVDSHGLGLSIVRRIVEKLGGQVGVENASGKGSLFYFSLPADAEARTAAAPAAVAGTLIQAACPACQESHPESARTEEW